MAETARVSVLDQIRGMKWNFWIANIIEAGERLAFFGVRAVVGLYIFGDHSVLNLSMSEKGTIFGIWALIQCLVPMVSGGYTERYGYRLTMCLAFLINIAGYLLMSVALSFWSMLAAACLVGLGTAIFKPPVQGSIAKSLDKSNSALGFGIFYWVVNIGGFFAPMLAAKVRGDDANPTWSYVFQGAALVTALNFLPALLLFREPQRPANLGGKSPVAVFLDTMKTLWMDKAMLRFLLIISGFWLMFMQLWDSMPNFIDEWVNTKDVGALIKSPFVQSLPSFISGWFNDFLLTDGSVKPEILINVDSTTIVLLVLPLSWLFGRLPMMVSLIIGMAIALVGFVSAGLVTTGYLVALMIFIFAIGEIMCSPKFSEYIGMAAPSDKKAQYMGYSNIPWAVGWAFGNFLSGPLYDLLSSKANLARRHLVEVLGVGRENLENLKASELLEKIAGLMGTTSAEAQDLLWRTYRPWSIWIVLGSIGFLSLLCMWIGYQRGRRRAA